MKLTTLLLAFLTALLFSVASIAAPQGSSSEAGFQDAADGTDVVYLEEGNDDDDEDDEEDEDDAW